ncbi:disulfide bond formation protein DsbC [Leptospira fletcheri]|uniref:Disulfide bond formation protein DsbC n=1 Tax=Leptospira fletcheri TaxID=2484981 RepID=A0A4R9GH72_9LEPT|nr:thioredoxin family protein [Leptospira fletcheri]TGK12060.1 disulfide bond formation protein DsbC [Leptospira fletcheri]
MPGFRIFSLLLFHSIVGLFPAAGDVFARSVSEYQGKHSRIELQVISLSSESVRFMVYLAPEEGWHIYWKNPGDSGTSLRTDWKTESPLKIEDWEWPVPKRIQYGDLTNFGYDFPVTLFAGAKPLETKMASSAFPIRAEFRWLVCKEECLPESAVLVLDSIGEKPVFANRFQERAYASSLAGLPLSENPNITVSFRKKGENSFLFRIEGENLPQDFDFFPEDASVLSHAKPFLLESSDEKIEFEIQKSEYSSKDPDSIRGVLKLGNSNHRVLVRSGAGSFFLQALFFAFLGGLLLNLMPCVFPVLFLKAFELSKIPDRRALFLESFFYFLGVLVFFWILYFAFLFLKTGGESLGWGYQLQNPSFVFLLIAIFFYLGLQMLGVAEFGISVSGSTARLADKSGIAGSFFSGALTVFVATPCTAPFMGSALAYALSEGIANGMTVFAFLALGTALPVLAIRNVPGLAGILPKPGPWMRTFREFLAFPLFLTSIWLFWVLGALADRNSSSIVLVWIVLSLFLLWVSKRTESALLNKAILLLAFVSLFGTAYYLRKSPSRPTVSVSPEHFPQEEFSKQRLDSSLKQGSGVFLYFTADWCITCKFNERTVLDSDDVSVFFKSKNIKVLKADWTNEDSEITKALDSYGRNSVPFYVYYPPGKSDRPKFLPTLLNKELLLKTLKE